MSQAYEVLLTNQLTRLDRLIAESESLASRANDEETLRYVQADLARWRKSRAHYEASLNRTKSLNRIVSRTLTTFGISFALLFVLSVLPLSENLLYAFAAADVLLVIGSGATYLIAITVRDAAARGHVPWRFSLRTMLITTTAIAVILGLLAYAARN